MCFVGLLTRLTLCVYVLSFAIVMLLCYSHCIFYHVTSFVRLRLVLFLEEFTICYHMTYTSLLRNSTVFDALLF